MKAVRKACAVIGGGVAGLTCATELARLGLESIIIEKASHFGGPVAHYSCKATDTCQRCGACLLEDIIGRAHESERISALTKATVTYVEEKDGNFRLKVVQQPRRIIPDRCTNCGECLSVCPQPRALIKSPLDGTISIDEEVCSYFVDGSCKACVEACGEDAFDMAASPEEWEVDTSAVVLAAGFKPYDPIEKPRFGYGLVPGVVTTLELDSLIRSDNFDPGEGENRIRSVAFIQCVGSRDVKIGRNYCSRICCGQSLRLARIMRHRFDGVEPVMFYMDIQSFDRDFEERLTEYEREVRLVRAIPGEIRKGSDNRPELVYQGPDDAKVVESFDLVALSIGMAPDPSLQPLGNLLGLSVNDDGFLGPDDECVVTEVEGVFVAGAVQGPKSITETIFHATRAAMATASFIEGRRK